MAETAEDTAGSAAPEPFDPAELRAAHAHGLTLVAWRAAGRPVSKTEPSKQDRSPRPYAPYRSKLEWRYAQHLNLLIVVGRVSSWDYEPETLELPGGTRWTVDWRVRHADGRETWDETKGLWRRHERIVMREMAAHYPDRVFRLVEWKRGGWKITELDAAHRAPDGTLEPVRNRA